MAALMALLHWDPQGERRRPHARVRVLGLTASIVKCRAEDRARFERDRQRLVDAMQANIEACAAPPRAPPTFREVSWPLPGEDVARERRTLAEGLVSLVLERVAEQGARSSGKTLGKVVRAAGVVLEELGRDAFVLALEHGVVAQIEARIDDWKCMPEREAAARALEGRLGGCRAALEEATAQVKERLRQAEQVQPVSDKVKALARALRETCDQQLHGMVFVSEVSLAVPLARLLQDELGLAVEVTSGVGSMREKDRNDAFWRFRSGRSPILVCTDCAEEGVDVSACAFVVRFSAFRTSKAHVQGAGRARLPRATVFYMHNRPEEEIRKADLMREVAEDASLPGPRATRECLPPGFERIPGVHPLVCPRTGAQVNFGNAQKLLQVYVAKVTGGQGSLEAEAALEGEEGDLAPMVPLLVGAARSGASGLVVPGPCGGCFLAETEVHRFFAGAAGAPGLPAQPRLHLCYVAVLVLRSRGWLDDHNCVPEGVVRQTAWPVEIGSVPVLSLRPGWRPLGLLGADREAAPARPPAPQGGESKRRRHAAGGAEQAKLEAIWLDPLAIENTQKTVNRTFSNGECVFRLMVALVLGTSRAAELPPMRVSFDEGSRRWFSADNRRCFAMKVVAPLIQLQSVEVDPINWTSEMGNKLNQRTIVGDVWATTQESIEAVRQEVAAAAQSMPEGAEHGAETDHEAADATAVAMAVRGSPRSAADIRKHAAQAPGTPSRDTAVEPARELGGNCSGCGGGDPGRGLDGALLAPQESCL
ncbi:unnamed protein product [Prorocentrum cordatum]|uniref:Helicase C-terminal domain-containing protein n=1 Tax=Prorocentrum cordatum TaxID=2364126 RepID=A0ABN9S4J1_9DINO|nr:unnamed protein product [Polarella glacialis]